MPQITLIGYRGTGKSTVAALVAARLGCEGIDADAVLESRLGTTIAAVIRDRGEPAFRAAEAEILADLLGSFRGVLATGGGVVLRTENRTLLRESGRPLVWLTAPADVIRGRLAADPTTRDRRPALTAADPLAEVEAALAARLPLYMECADVAFDGGTEPPGVIADRIVHWLAAHGRDSR
jgi:shikimate kinase